MQGGQLQDYIGIFRPTLKGEVLEEARPHYLLAAENFHRLAKEEMRGPEFYGVALEGDRVLPRSARFGAV